MGESRYKLLARECGWGSDDKKNPNMVWIIIPSQWMKYMWTLLMYVDSNGNDK